MCSKIFFLLSSVVFIKAKWTIAVCILVCRKMRPIYLRPFIWDHDIWDHIHLRPHSHETFSFETTFTWDHIHLSPHSFQIISIWDHIHLTPHSFETKLIWDHIHLRSHSFETTFIWDYIHLRPHLFETIHLRPHSLETTFIVDHIHFRSHSFYAMSKWSCFDLLLITLLWPTFHFFVGDLKFCKVDQVNYMFCVPAHFLYRGATIVSVLTWKMKDEKRKNVLLRWLKQSQEKIKFRGLWEERCNRIWAKRLTQDLYKCDYFSR